MERYDILVVEDDETLIHAFQRMAADQNRSLAVARSGPEAVDLLSKAEIDVALVDLNLDGLSGLELLDRIKQRSDPTEVILMTGGATVESAIAVLKKGAYDYLIKPFDRLDRVSLIIEKAREKAELLRRVKSLERQGGDGDRFPNLLGKSEKMREVFRLIETVAPSRSSVLILGESGTGKELVARALHERSERREKPFVVINCSALPETLLESELFGYQKGSFTGAVSDKKGLFEESDGGTIFLDEIGEISPTIQVKLLRVLQDGEVRRLGGSRNCRTDVRILSATNKDLQEQVKKREFREDLFYRLNVISIGLPPLRDRRDDVPLLAAHFLKKYADRTSKTVSRISVDALQTLQEYRWPGNVRELENVIERAVVMSTGETITARDLPPKLLGEFFYLPEPAGDTGYGNLPYREAKEKALNLFNRTYISHLLTQTGGNISLASEKAGMDRSNFKKIVRKCDVATREFRKKGGER